MATEKRLIDANVLDEKCRQQMADQWNRQVAPVSWAEAYGEFLDDIWDAPTVDAVEVVRCRDCDFSEPAKCRGVNICHYWSPFKDALVPDAGFCHRGERRTDNG